MSKFFIKQAFAEAIDLQKNGKYKEAKELYSKILKNNPDDANAQHLISLIFMAEGNFNDAKKYLELAIKSEPNQAVFLSNYGALLHSMGDNKSAIVAYEKAIHLDQKHFQSYYSLGIIYSDLKDYDRAVENYQRSLEIDNSSAPAHNNLANVFSNTNNPEAEYHYKKLIELVPDQVYPRLNMANFLIKQSRFNDAMSALDELVSMDIATKEVFNSLGVCYKGIEDNENAIKMFRQALSIDGNFPLAIENLKSLGEEA